MEAIGFFQDVVFTAFLALIVYFVLPKLLSYLGGCDLTTRDAGIVDKAGFLGHIRKKLPEKALGVSEFRLMSCDDHNEKDLKGKRFSKDDAVIGINNSRVVKELFVPQEEFKGEKECVGGGGSDDVEAKVVDECSERPILGEIQEEKGSPVAEAQVKFVLGDDLIQEEKVSPKSQAQMTLDVREDVEVREANNDEGFTENSGSENTDETMGITSENSKSNDHHVEEEGLSGDDWEGIERTELEKRFDAAMSFVESKSNADRIDGNLRLQFYGLQRVAMEGPCHEPQPMALKVSARAKWNAWQKLGNMSEHMAMEQYMALLSENIPEWEDKRVNSPL